MKNINLEKINIANDRPFTLIAGLNVLEEKIVKEVVEKCIAATSELDIPYIFKASFDKANRSSVDSYRGPGIEQGLRVLEDIKSEYDVPVLSDIHSIDDIEEASKVLDIIQIPAFLCRQTDLIEAASRTNLPVNIKKGQFLAPDDCKNIISKFTSFDNDNLMICERGTSFGYNNLVVDMLGISTLKKFNYPVIFDVTHSLQIPGGLGNRAGGRRSSLLDLARSGMSLGLAGLFLEVHPNPDQALCDGPSALPIEFIKPVLEQIKLIDDLVKGMPQLEIN